MTDPVHEFTYEQLVHIVNYLEAQLTHVVHERDELRKQISFLRGRRCHAEEAEHELAHRLGNEKAFPDDFRTKET